MDGDNVLLVQREDDNELGSMLPIRRALGRLLFAVPPLTEDTTS
jgi:hypothetical protein